MSEELKKHIKDKIPATTKPARVVFGIEIGKNYPNKTIVDAILTRLYTLTGEIDYATPSRKEETEENLRLFLETWDQDPSLTEEEKKSVLGLALIDAKQSRSKWLMAAEKERNKVNSWHVATEGLIAEEKYTSSIESSISARYNKVINQLKRMIEKQKNNDNVM